jgi:drug/metabolite transporter, DME family
VPVSTRPIGAVLLAAVLFGTAGTAQELGPDATTPLAVGAARIVIGTLVLWLAIAAVPGGPSWSDVVAAVGRHRRLVLLGGVGVAVYTPAFLTAVDRAGVAVGTVVAIASGPFFAALLEWAWHGVTPNRGWIIGTLVTVAGVVALVLAAEPPDGGGIDPIGLLLALAAGAGYALYSVTAKRTMTAGVSPTLSLAAPFTVGAVIVAALAGRESFAWITTGEGALMALHLGVLATGAAYLLFGYGLHRLTSATTVTLVLAEPLTAAVLGAILLDEVLGPAGWAGVATVLAGLFVVGRTAEVAIEPVPTVDDEADQSVA